MGDPALSELSTELENAGLVGGGAASILGVIAFGDSAPGFLTTTPNGAVWTKSVSNAAKHSANLGIAKLTFEGGSLNATAAFAFDDEGLTYFNLLIELAGANAATMLTLEFDTAHAYLAPAKKQGTTIVGYTDPQQPKPVKLPLPVAMAIEFSITRSGDDILSAVTLHGSPAGPAAIAQGIYRFDLGDDVLVLPKLGKVGISLKDLFVDFSSTAATPVSDLFTEVYAPSWTGVGAKAIGIHFPIDKKVDEWVNATLDGFLLGFDGKASLKGKVAYSNNDNAKLINSVAGEIDIRNNEVVRGALELGLNFDKAVAAVSDTADGSSIQGLSSSQKNLVTTSRTNKANAKSQPAFSFAGDLKCRAQIIRIPLGSDDDIIGFDISVEAVETPGQPTGLVLQGTAARALFWAGLGGGAAALLITGVEDDDAGKVAGGIGLTFLLICDVGDFIVGNSPKLLPTLERFELRKLGYRFVTMPTEGATPAKSVHQFSLDAVISMTFDGTLSGLISAIIGRGIDTAQEFGKLFAKSASEIEIKGPLDLEISNMTFGWETTDTGSEFVSTVDERVRRVAGQKDLQIKPRKVPTIGLKSSPGSSTSSIPKPIVKADFVTKETNGETQYGVSLRISGLENPDFKLESPFVIGIVAYFSPEFRLEFEASLIVEPRFRFVIPYWVLVDGAFELNKEIPGFDGVQNRISVDVGVINNKVAKGSDIGKDNLRLLNDISNYNYQFGGEVAWGEAFKTDPVKRLEFLFVEAHYEGASPIFVIGPVGIYGLGGLFGKNIAPGISGDTRDASAIAKWIEGNGDGFENVMDWPAPPRQDTWHPAKDFVEDEPLIVAGLKVRAGPVGSRTVDVDGLLMLGFDEFWIAAAGNVKVKAINLNAITIVVYDDPSRSFTLRIRFDFALKSGSDEILGISGPIEISSGNNGFRVAFGHFLPERGGPLVARLFKDFYRAQFYAAYDSKGQDAFGFALPGMDDRPDLGKKAYSQGAMYQYGPKRIGPSAVNIRVHAAAGYNFGLSGDPFMIVGELFLSGSLRVKVLFIKVGFTLTAYLAGRLTSERFDFRGKLTLEIGMPWPIPDIDVSVSLGFTIGGDKPAIPSVSLEATVHALTHSEPKAEEFPEPKAEELPESGIPFLPIDAVIGLKFNRPIVAIFEGASTATALPDIDPINQIDPAQPQNSPFVETVKTTLDGKDYTIEYEHYLSNVRVSHRPVGGGAEVVVPSMFASWEVPAVYDDSTGAPDASDKPHHAIYLNSLLQPGLDFAPEKLGKFIRGQIVNGVMPPCRKPERVCLIAGKAPDISEDATTGLRVAWRASPYGSISVRETAMPQPPSPITLKNWARLGWTGSALSLPREARIEVPPAGRVTAEIELHTILSRLAGTVLVTLDVKIAGVKAPARLVMAVDFDPSVPCALDLKTEVLSSASAQVSLDAKVKACATRGVIVLAVEVAARKPGVRLRRMTLRGPRLIPPGTGRDAGNVVPDPDRWLKLMGELTEGPTLFLNELCFETLEATHGAWETVTQNFGNGPATDASIEQFLGNLLLEPNREYTVKYSVQSYGRSTIDTDSGGSIDDEATFDTDSTLTGGLRTVRFQTEAEPSQTISRYVGFTYPAPQMAPVYPDQTVPLVSYRNNGLIKRIYEIHKGAGALKSKIRDLDGKELATAATGTLSVSSGAAGEVMEGLIGTCLEAARGFTRIEVDMFERALKTDTRYGLSVEDTTVTPGANDLPPYRSAFRTSRYQSFAAHLAAVNALLADPVQVPLIDDSPSQLLAPVFADVASGNLAGYDDLVEAIYRRTLAHETGRLADEFGRTGDVAAQLVAQLSDGSLASFGIALELGEPLIGKEGVGFGGMELPLPVALEDKGITQHQVGTTRLVSVRDRSGSRLIVFRTSDVTNFAAVLAPVQMPVTFDGTKAVRIAVQDYVGKTYAALDENDRKKEFDAAMTKLAALPEMAGGLVETTGNLLFNPMGGP